MRWRGGCKVVWVENKEKKRKGIMWLYSELLPGWRIKKRKGIMCIIKVGLGREGDQREREIGQVRFEIHQLDQRM